MNIKFNDKTKAALQELLLKSNEGYIKIRVFRGCGKPAYEIFPTFKSEDDSNYVTDEISFVFNKEAEGLINGIEIIYDTEIYNTGFYVKNI